MKSQKVLNVLAFLLPTVLVSVALVRVALSTYTSRKASSESQKAIREWTSRAFVSITDQAFPDLVKKLVLSGRGRECLSKLQTGYLMRDLLLFFRAYTYGSYEAYHTFRMPPGTPYTITTNMDGGTVESMLTDFFGLPKESVLTNKEQSFKMFLIASEGYGTIFSNYLTGVCFTNSRVVISAYKPPVPRPWEIRFFESAFREYSPASLPLHFPNLGIISQRDDLTFVSLKDSIESIASEHGTVYLADVFMLLERRPPELVVPLILRLYWNPRTSRWLPDDLVICSKAQRRNSRYSRPAF